MPVAEPRLTVQVVGGSEKTVAVTTEILGACSTIVEGSTLQEHQASNPGLAQQDAFGMIHQGHLLTTPDEAWFSGPGTGTTARTLSDMSTRPEGWFCAFPPELHLPVTVQIMR